MPTIFIAVKQNSVGMVPALHRYLSVIVPKALSTRRHPLKEGDITLSYVVVPDNFQSVDVLVEVKAAWDFSRWVGRDKRTIQIRDFTEASLFMDQYEQDYQRTVAVDLHLSMSAYAGSGYGAMNFHAAMVATSDWEGSEEGDVKHYAFPQGSYYVSNAA